MLRTLTTLVVFASLLGCYRYAPVRLEQAPVGAQVRLELSERGSTEAATVLGHRTSSIDGELQERDPRVVLAVDVSALSQPVRRELQRPVVLDPDDVVGVGVRERHRTRTALLAGSLAAVVVGGAIAAFSGTFGGTSSGRGPEQPEGTLIPLWLRLSPDF